MYLHKNKHYEQSKFEFLKILFFQCVLVIETDHKKHHLPSYRATSLVRLLRIYDSLDFKQKILYQHLFGISWWGKSIKMCIINGRDLYEQISNIILNFDGCTPTDGFQNNQGGRDQLRFQVRITAKTLIDPPSLIIVGKITQIPRNWNMTISEYTAAQVRIRKKGNGHMVSIFISVNCKLYTVYYILQGPSIFGKQKKKKYADREQRRCTFIS